MFRQKRYTDKTLKNVQLIGDEINHKINEPNVFKHN